jgi:hypothetical protein
MRARGIAPTALAVVALVSWSTACSDESRDALEDDARSAATEVAEAVDEASEDAVELAARNFASVQATQEFESAGYPIDGDLRCDADATDDLTAVEITCTGETVDGETVEMEGVTSEFPGLSINELDGSYVGTVDGDEVFTTERLGD